MSVQVQSHQIELGLTNAITRVEIAISNDRGQPIDPSELKLTVMDAYNRTLFTDVLYPALGEIITPLPSRIVRDGRGRFFFPFGADNSCGWPATFTGNQPPSGPWDLSVSNVLSISFDKKAYLPIFITGAVQTAVTPAEVVAAINAALVASPVYGPLYSVAARYWNNQLFLTSPLATNPRASQVNIDQTVSGDCTTILFGPVVSLIQVTGTATPSRLITALLSNRTNCPGDAIFHWQVRAAKGLGSAQVIQVVKVASPHVFAILPYFRTEIDKALKQIDQNAARTGYTDAQLMGYLALAVTEINAYQPITNMTLENFPSRDFMMILIWTATLIALISQGLFAVDTDIEYSDRGASFRMDHASKIQSYAQIVITRLEARMQAFKLQYAPIGTVKFEVGVSLRLAAMLEAAPSGSLFRGLFQGGV